MTRWGRKSMKLVGVALAAITAQAVLAGPVMAQDADARVRKLEAEVKALQRVVFPGGDAKFFPGASTQNSVTTPNGTPAASPLTDVLTRMDAIEAQNARLTAQVEELSNRLRQLDAARAAPSGGVDGSAAVVAAPVPVPAARPAPEPAPKPVVAKTAPAPAPVPAPVAAKPAPTRVAAVKAIVKPQSNDAGEDEYSYGFKLYEAKFYPEAEQQLKLFLDQYPKHKRVTYARNLLGRALLDEGKAREAAPWFLQNYQANKKGERASDSLLYLADAMIAMKDTNRACIALGEFADGYPVEAQGRLRTAYETVRAKVACN
jgi:TolA-binding protein